MSFTPGLPVPIGGIEKELGRLWEESGESKTRASLINLAIYSEVEGSLQSNSAIIHGIAGEHAMRAILIHADPSATESSAEAWISMNCYLRGAKGGEVCSEQISFQLAGEAARSLQSVVFSHLDSDLPLVLWWQADFHPPIDGKIWRWVDRLLFDSRHWQAPKEQFALVSKISAITEARTVLCDLNWTRTFSVRQAVSGIFDSSASLPELQTLRSVHLEHAPEYRSTALLLLGWLADRLGWELTGSGVNPTFQDAKGHQIATSLHATEGASINRVQLKSETAIFEVLREAGSDLFVTSTEGAGLARTSRMVRAPREGEAELLLAELTREGQHALYRKSIKAVASLWD